MKAIIVSKHVCCSCHEDTHGASNGAAIYFRAQHFLSLFNKIYILVTQQPVHYMYPVELGLVHQGGVRHCGFPVTLEIELEDVSECTQAGTGWSWLTSTWSLPTTTTKSTTGNDVAQAEPPTVHGTHFLAAGCTTVK